jgi:hypothetical protein
MGAVCDDCSSSNEGGCRGDGKRNRAGETHALNIHIGQTPSAASGRPLQEGVMYRQTREIIMLSTNVRKMLTDQMEDGNNCGGEWLLCVRTCS